MTRPPLDPTGEISLDGQLNLERMRRLITHTKDIDTTVKDEMLRLAKVIEQLRTHKNSLNHYIDYLETQN